MNLKIRLLSVVLLACATFGCTSFRTTSLYRFSNDSLAPQRTNKKLKGLPVKLKVPSHVSVVVYEQQVILANDPAADQALKDAADQAINRHAELNSKIENLTKTINTTRESRESAANTLKTYQDAFDRSTGAQQALAKVFRDNATKVFEAAVEAESNALLDAQNEAEFRKRLNTLQQEMVLAREKAATGYVLVSFSPPQYQVETQLEYTDKIFLIDFKRPAAGTLDLKNAKMDDQQYFSQVQAEIEEKTIESIGGALKTITDPLVSLRPKMSNSAKPTSASTPEGESKDDVNFQKSVVAIQRFDISEPGWEDEMMWFVNEKLNASSGASGEMEGLVGQLSQR